MSKNGELFDRWFVSPVKLLHEKLADNDGGFVALAVGIFLYERLHKALKASGMKVEQSLSAQFANDFGICEKEAELLWDMLRNGLFHEGMLKQKDRKTPNFPGYDMSAKHPALTYETSPPCFKFDPFKLAFRVFDLWQPHLDLFDLNTQFPVPAITVQAEGPHTHSAAPAAPTSTK